MPVTSLASTPKGEQTASDIVTAAFNLFVEHGYHGTSMRKIAQAAGLSVGSLYNHFATKEEIFKQVVLTYHPFVTVLPLLSQAEGETAESLIRQAAQMLVAEFEDRPEFLNLLIIELIERQGSELAELVQVFLPQVLTFSQTVQQAEGDIRSESAIALVRSLIGMVVGYLLSGYILNQLPPGYIQPSSLDEVLEIYLHGILKPPTGANQEPTE
jgi:AcrR family transcriptional regulator